jgi:hypothetical protein
MKHPILVAGALALGILVAQGAAAQPQGGGGMGVVRQACAADIQKYCADVQRGGGRIGQCMRSHMSDLSDGCKSALAQMRAQHQGGDNGQH